MTISKFTDYFTAIYRHLWLSISSVAFYSDVRTRYKGYGLRYIFAIYCISSLASSISIFYDIERFKGYFVNNSNETVEYIFTQIPDINYDGHIISTNVELPHFIYDLQARKLAVIDLEGALSGNEKAKIPLILTKKNIKVSVTDITSQKQENVDFDYATIFGTNAQILTAVSIKEYCGLVLSYSTRVFIYLFMPILILLRFVALLFEKSLMVITIYVVSNALGTVINPQTACRLVMFASGLSVLMQPIINIFIPQLAYLGLILQIIPGVMLVINLVQSGKTSRY
ncbi:MAG: DUF1189 family protein [Pseudomonadota bacterium]